MQFLHEKYKKQLDFAARGTVGCSCKICLEKTPPFLGGWGGTPHSPKVGGSFFPEEAVAASQGVETPAECELESQDLDQSSGAGEMWNRDRPLES